MAEKTRNDPQTVDDSLSDVARRSLERYRDQLAVLPPGSPLPDLAAFVQAAPAPERERVQFELEVLRDARTSAATMVQPPESVGVTPTRDLPGGVTTDFGDSAASDACMTADLPGGSMPPKTKAAGDNPDYTPRVTPGSQARRRSGDSTEFDLNISSPTGGLANYEIMGELGRGGMGVVYKARQKGLNRLVALKMVLAGAHASSTQLARFQIEARAVAKLQHVGIVQVYEVGEDQGLPYFSLEFVDGGPRLGVVEVNR